MEYELKFPLIFDSCPHCGSTRRLAGTVAEQEKEKGKLNKEANAFVFMHSSIIADPKRTLLSAPALVTFFDVCADCGTVYCIRAELGQATPQMRSQPRPNLGQFGFPQSGPSLS